MVFSSIEFLFYFFPIVICIYYLTPTTGGKNIVLLTTSFLFYFWGEPRFFFILLLLILFNSGAALAVDRLVGIYRRFAVAIAIVINLTSLVIFKYLSFIIENVNGIAEHFDVSISDPKLTLPLGVSFFTFHCLSYIIDVYRRRFRANRNLLQVALYIVLFPQLVAGPIVRYKNVARQLRFRRHTLARASAGARIFVIGLAQKVLIADQVATIADVVFDTTRHPSLFEAWIGTLSYTVQIYFDFAGYSNMAIGMGVMFGFTLPQNFRLPYRSQSITEFWRRWHMSLSSWLRDYVYIPLGGNRYGALSTYRNLISVFLLCGLWHGASWNFVIWGLWHGIFLVLERLGIMGWTEHIGVFGRRVYALSVVTGGWIVFRANDLAPLDGSLKDLLVGMGSTRSGSTSTVCSILSPWRRYPPDACCAYCLRIYVCCALGNDSRLSLTARGHWRCYSRQCSS